MPKDTPSMAKNKIKRCLNTILDPHPNSDDIARIWQHFQSSCAYCGIAMERHSRQGHLDHAISAAFGGKNSINSHVLACARCNGDEKREEAWETFLQKKCASPEILEYRKMRITEWLAMATLDAQPADDEIHRLAQEIIVNAIKSFDRSVAEMKRLRKIVTQKTASDDSENA